MKRFLRVKLGPNSIYADGCFKTQLDPDLVP